MIIILHSYDFPLIITNAIAISANFSSIICKRYRKLITTNPDNNFRLHYYSSEFEPIRDYLENSIDILFICVDISNESLEIIKLSYPECQYKIITETECLSTYPEYFSNLSNESSNTSSNASSLTITPHYTIQSMFDNNISIILPNKLYLTNYIGASNLEELQTNKITHIINITDIIENYFENHFKYLKISIPDSHNITITDYFPTTFEFIDNAINNGGRVLVHCFAGKSRSASIIIGYLMKQEKINFEGETPLTPTPLQAFENALQIVQRIRPCVEPNLAFCTQLCQYYDAFKL